MAAARDVPVTLLREILLVPFAIEACDRTKRFARSGSELVQELVRLLDRSSWREITPRWLHLPEDEGRTGDALAKAYAEFVYFEPYVQRYLFGERGERPEHAPIRLFRREDVTAVDLAVREPGAHEPACFRFRVDRLNLYLFDTGNAMLVLELRFDPGLAKRLPEGKGGRARASMDLALALTLHERLRRVFPPYFASFDTTGTSVPAEEGLVAPLFPIAFRPVVGEPAHVVPDFTEDPHIRAAAGIAHLGEYHCPPLHPTWRRFLEPLPIEGYAAGAHRVVLSQMGDDRAFALLILGVEEAHAIERSDWVRLAMADEAGEGLPYAAGFLEDFERRHCYDRFFETGTGMTTRFLFSPYAMALVGSCAPAEKGGFDFFREVTADHGRRHYFQLALIAYFQKNALLTLSERLSNALEAADADPQHFEEAAEAIERDVLRFTHRYWFEDISAQIQGQEFFDRLREMLRLRPLYDQIAREVREANQVSGAREQRELARKAARLNRTVFVGLVLAAVTGALGMNVYGDGLEGPAGLAWFVLLLLAGVGLFAVAWNLPIEEWLDRHERRRR